MLEANRASMAKEMEGQPKESVDMAMKMAETMFSQIEGSLVIKEGGELAGDMSMGPAGTISMTGTWTQSGNTLTMNTRDSKGNEETQDATVDGDTLTIIDGKSGQEMQIIFTRQ